jgi:hypothetical protein
MSNPILYFFGAYDGNGHHLYVEDGNYAKPVPTFPWSAQGHDIEGVLQPRAGVRLARGEHPERVEGEALLHGKSGWTALCFWDRSVDTRLESSSNYFAEGTFTVDEMISMASARFAKRWNKMKFAVRLAEMPSSA